MPENQIIAKLNGVEIAYYDLPALGEEIGTILLIHGFASNGRVNWISTGWTKLLNDAGYRTIVIDNRGHGASTKFYSAQDYGPDIFARDGFDLLDYLNIPGCHILGFSMGARIACWMAYQSPDRVSSAVFGGMGSHIFGGRGGYEKIAKGLETEEPDLLTDPGAIGFRRFADRTNSDRLALAACIRPSKHRITHEIVSSIKLPVLVAVGSEDEVGGSAVELVEMMLNAEAFVMEGLDHMKSSGALVFKKKVLEFLNGQNLNG